MSGAVDAVKNTVSSAANTVTDTLGDVIKNPLKGIAEAGAGMGSLATGGIFAGIAGQKAAKGVAEGGGVIPSITSAAGQTMEETGVGKLLMGDKPALPNIAIQDPAALASKNAADRAAAARAAQVQFAQDTPGRGGTILTDRYTYRT